MLIHSAVITGSVQLNNTDVSSITNVAGFATTSSVDSLVVKTGSYASTSSLNELQSKTGSYATTSSVNNLQSVTGSYVTTSSFGAYTSSNDSTNTTQNTRLSTIESVTGSYATTSSVNNLQSVTGSYASTGSNQFNGNQSISGSITSNGTITAQTLVVQTVTSSIEFVTGSTRNGSLSSNTHQFTGSVLMSGSLTVGGATTLGGITSNSTISSNLTNGTVLIRDNGTSQVEVNIRHTNSRNGVLSFTQDGVADRWAIGTKPSDGSLYFSSNFDLLSPKLTISSTGAATFSGSVTAPYYLVTSNIPSSTASTGYLDYSGGGTRLFSVGTSGATKGTFRFIAKGADDSSIEPLGISATGAATFSSTVTTGDVLYVGAGGGGGGVWTWGVTEAYIHSPTSKNLNLTTDGGLTKGLRITTSGAATFSNNVTMGAYILTQNGVGRVCFSGQTQGNQSISVTVNCSSQSSMRITCMFNHYGLFNSYGCARMSFYAIGPSSDESVISNVASGNGGSWSFARVSNTSFTITKNAGTYSGDGLYFIEVVGATLS